MQIELKPELAARVEALVEAGRFESATQFLQDAAELHLRCIEEEAAELPSLSPKERDRMIACAEAAIAEGVFIECEPGWASVLLERALAERKRQVA